MQNFEKLGTFYLGKQLDQAAEGPGEDLVLYDSKDLTTHAVIVGMTGSGKTGLGIGLIEEAALDKIPVIAIDPKGDLGNLLLSFPDLEAGDFEPWVDPREAAEQGLKRPEFAAEQAQLWRNGLADWGQDGARIAKMRDSAEFCIYTPGSSAGRQLALLKSFAAPDAATIDDADLYRERLQATVTGLLALLGIDADPVSSREHILISNILDNAWRDGKDLDLAALIGAIQSPPFAQIGIMQLDAFYPEKDRFGLAMRLNALLAAPGFQAWLEGEPLDAERLLYSETGKPRVSIISIAHLDDNERMFFVSMLLGSFLSWMRAQPGSGSLRAMLYMDEIFGYMPPLSNPPSKMLLLTLLKQARAFGVGLTLSTQNPVDLDYKGLSNTGTWFIGRMQTERDLARVMDGLEGAGGEGFDRQAIERTIAGLGKRNFLLHNVHEDEPVVFNTRWVMSYLAGPLTRDQIRLLAQHNPPLSAAAPAESAPAPRPAPAARVRQPTADAPAQTADQIDERFSASAPALGSSISQLYLLPLEESDDVLVYQPTVFAAAELVYQSARYSINSEAEFMFIHDNADSAMGLDWDDAQAAELDLKALRKRARKGARFAQCPNALASARNFKKWQTAFKRWLRTSHTLTVYRSDEWKTYSEVGETEAAFRIRLQQLAAEDRDQEVAKLRQRYARKSNTLEERLRRAQQKLEVEQQQATQKKYDAAISFGSALLGAVLGRKRTSAFGSAFKSVGRIRKEHSDVGRAEETIEAIQQDLLELQQEFEAEAERLPEYDAQREELREIQIRAKSTDIEVRAFTLLWRPYYLDESGELWPAWD